MAMAIAMINERKKRSLAAKGNDSIRFKEALSHGAFGIFFMIRIVVESYISSMLET